jgi:Inovirus Coat protein B
MNKIINRAAGVSALVLIAASNAHAALDVTAATTAIADTGTALVAVVGALLTMYIGVWGLKKVVAFFRG